MEQYTYESKCRRCGKLHEWYVTNAEDIDQSSWFKYMDEKSTYASLSPCIKCKKHTLQDVVSYVMNPVNYKKFSFARQIRLYIFKAQQQIKSWLK